MKTLLFRCSTIRVGPCLRMLLPYFYVPCFAFGCLYADVSKAEVKDLALLKTPQSVWVSPGFYSYHFKRGDELRDRNPGLGLTLRYSEASALVLGRFRNSDNAMSNYLGYLYQPYIFGPLRVGLALAAFDGYPEMQNGKAFLSVIPTMGFSGERFALNVGIIPEIKERVHGAVSLQFLVRFGP